MATKRITRFLDSLKSTIRMFPVEFGIILYAFVLSSLMHEDVLGGNDEQLALAPLFFSLAYILNNLIKCPRGRWAYYLSWVPAVSLWLVDVEPFVRSAGYPVALICALLGILVCRRATDNTRFAKESLRYVLNLIISFVFAGVAHLAAIGIYYSIRYIFGFEWDDSDFLFYSSILSYMVAVPLMFLAFNRANLEKEWQPTKFFDVLMNFIITPALLVYTLVLYTYFIKIAITWTLPDGLVATMVLCFAVVGIFAKALQPLLGKRHYDWFFDRFGLLSAPALVMFWVSVIYRVAAYGLTEMRVYLLIGGAVMTITIFMFVGKGRGRYFTMALVAVGLLSLFTYLPFMSAKNIALCNQQNRFERLAQQYGVLDHEGQIKPTDQLPAPDSANRKDYREMAEALRYVERKGDSPFGSVSYYDLRSHFQTYAAGERGYLRTLYLRSDQTSWDISEYSTLLMPEMTNYYLPDCFYTTDADTLKVYRKRSDVEELIDQFLETQKSDTAPGNNREEAIHNMNYGEKYRFYDTILVVPFSEIAAAQLGKVGVPADSIPTEESLEPVYDRFMNYEFPNGVVMMSSMNLDILNNAQKRIDYIEVSGVLLK